MNRTVRAVVCAGAVAVLAAVGAVWATPEWRAQTVYLDGKHIQLSITDKDYNRVDSLYNQSLLENLDSFADSLKKAGKLSLGQIRLRVGADWQSGPSGGVNMYRHKNGYYCFLRKHNGQTHLKKIIAYFASDKWESFCPDYEEDDPPDFWTGYQKELKIFNRRIDTIKVTHDYAPRKVLDVNGGIAVYFQNDSLVCKDAKNVYGAVANILPFSVGSKAFITVTDAIYVVENGKVVNKFKTKGLEFDGITDEYNYSVAKVEIFPEWVNLKNAQEYFLSYSIPKNKFYKVKPQEQEE